MFADEPAKTSGNPILPGRYADPEAVVFGRTYWIYPTCSAPYRDQVFFDAFSSDDLVAWRRHPRILDAGKVITRSFSLDTRPATVTVAAGYTKNGETATQEITPDLILDLPAYLVGLAEGSPAFPLPEKGAEMLRVDLAAAGVPHRDGSGRVFDFHAIRCQLATTLDQAGVSPRVVQRKMRHSTPELTGRYTRPRDQEPETATAALPKMGANRPTPDPILSTPDQAEPGRIGEDFPTHLPRAAGGRWRDGRPGDRD